MDLDALREHTMPDMSRGCWLWTKNIGKDGYGLITVAGRIHRAHRLAFEVATGAALGSAMACHRCDVRACINPDHLYAGDAKTNARDMVERGRIQDRTGENGSRAKLTLVQAREIKALLLEPLAPGRQRRRRGFMAALAKRYGVARTIIHRIGTGEIWSNA